MPLEMCHLLLSSRHFFDNFITGAWKLPKSFLSGNPNKMPVKCQYKFFTRLIVADRVICQHPNAMKTQKDNPFTSE